MASETNSEDEEMNLEELKKRHQKGSRVSGATYNREADNGDSSENESDTLETSIGRAFERLDSGDGSKSLSVRDEQLAALIHGLEAQDEEFAAVGVALQEALGRETDPEGIDRSEILRLAIRVGLREAAPEVIESARSAQVRHLTEQF